MKRASDTRQSVRSLAGPGQPDVQTEGDRTGQPEGEIQVHAGRRGRQPTQVLSPATASQAPAEISLPALRVRQLDELDPLPKELWLHILSFLNEPGLRRSLQVCAQFRTWAAAVQPQVLDPNSRLAQWERRDCMARLRPNLESYSGRCKESNRRLRSDQFALEYEKSLTQSAAQYRYLEFPVWLGFEAAAFKALSSGGAWQYAVIEIGEDADRSFLAKLEAALKAQGRAVELTLNFHAPGSWDGVVLDGQALQVRSVTMQDFDADEIKAFKSNPGITALDLDAGCSTDPLMDDLLATFSNLRQLGLRYCPDSDLRLLQLVAKNSQLEQLTLSQGELKAGGLTLAALLDCAPGLRILRLSDMTLSLGSTADCLEAFKRSDLQSLGFSRCTLDDEHAELMLALEGASNLRRLEISYGLNEAEKSAAMKALRAFSGNPNAETVLLEDGEASYRIEELSSALLVLNQARTQRGWSSLVLSSVDSVPVDTWARACDFVSYLPEALN